MRISDWISDVCSSDLDQINRGLATYSSLPHRMERVTEHDGVLFINDSKATNTASTAPALAAWPPMPSIHGGAPRIHWILGGLAGRTRVVRGTSGVLR